MLSRTVVSALLRGRAESWRWPLAFAAFACAASTIALSPIASSTSPAAASTPAVQRAARQRPPVEERTIPPLPAATVTDGAKASEQVDVQPTSGGVGSTPNQAADAGPQPSSDLPAEVQTRHIEVGPGDSLYALFERHGLAARDLVQIVAVDKSVEVRLARLAPGHRFDVDATPEGRVWRLRHIDPSQPPLTVTRRDDEFVVARDQDLARVEVPTREPTRAPAVVASPVTEARPVDEASTPAAAGAPTAPGVIDLGRPLAATADTLLPGRDDVSAAPPSLQLPGPLQRPTPVPRVAEVAPPEYVDPAQGPRARTLEVGRGESLYAIFQRERLSTADLSRMLASGSAGALLRTVHPGERIEVAADADGAVAWLEYHPSIERYARFQRKGDGFDGSVVDVPLERRLSTVAGTVESSLFEAGLSAGLTDRLVMELVEIFAWDVDFALDIRVGDSFTVVHEELLKDGEKVRDGAVLAAEFVNRGRALRAVRYEDPSGLVRYYTPEGESLRKAFLRTPVKFSRISSRFTLARMHPVLHRFRAHKGVDYAAPRGTPVKATGDGKVAFVGRKGGYGKTVVLQHGSAYTTLYGHLSRFARGLRQGDRVTQGDLIGYVGSTGLATGPHLHYEFRVRGVHRDPLTVKLPRSLPIPAEHKRDFGTKTRQLIATLEAASQTRLASTSAAR